MNVGLIHGQPTPEDIEKYIFHKWDKALGELAKGPSEPYPAYHEVEKIPTKPKGEVMPAKDKTELAVFEDGSTRSILKERYDLVPKEAIDALARRLAMGAETHGENNWRCGGVEFRKASINHLMRHLLDYIEHGNANDSNTDAIICNAAFLCHFEAAHPFAGCDPQNETPRPPRRQTS